LAQPPNTEIKGKTAETADLGEPGVVEREQPLANQAQDLRREDSWNAVLAKFDDSKVDGVDLPDAQISTAPEPTYVKVPGVKEEVSLGEFIKINVPPVDYKLTAEQSVLDIATKHLGPGATPEQVKKHAAEIYVLNYVKLDNVDSELTATAKAGEIIRAQGHTTRGDIVIADSQKTTYSLSESGRLEVKRVDGTGFERSFTDKNDGSYVEKHFGPKETDKFSLIKSADGRVLSSDRAEEPLLKSYAEQKGQLERLIKEKVVLQPEAEKLRADMKSFEERAARDGLSKEEITRTYRDLAQVLELKGNSPQTQRERVRMVLGAVAAAADPTSNDQGKYNTCQVAVIENRLYARQPSAVTGVLAQIARDGKFTAQDGTVTTMESTNLRAHGDAALNIKNGTWTRSYASQIFQTAAISAYYTQENLSKLPPGDVHYYQKAKVNDYDSGETLVDYSRGKEHVLDNGPGEAGNLNNMIKINEQLTGKWQPELFLANKSLTERAPEHAKATSFASADELGERLKALKDKTIGPLYATLYVHVNSDALVGTRRDHPLMGPASIDNIINDGHVMNVIDYDPKTRTVKLDGQWGNDRDFIKKPLTLEQAYEATQSLSGTKWMQRAEAVQKSLPPEKFNEQLANVANALSLSWTSDLQLSNKIDLNDASRTVAAYERLRNGRTSSAFRESDQNIQILRNEINLARKAAQK
jgi:hypothetical protein